MPIFYNPNRKKGLFFIPSGATGGERLAIEYSAARFCENDTDPIPGITGETGGIFSSTTGLVFISTSTGQVDLDASTAGTYVVTYTAPSSETATTSITIDTIPVVSAGSDVAICDGENTVLTATGATTYLWSTGETTASITVDPTTTTSYTVTGFNGACSATDSVQVTVNAQDSAAFSYAESAYCANGTDPTPTITGTTGGAFTSTAGLVINSGTGEIDLDASTVGTYSVTYTTTGVCPANQSVNITINAADNAGFNYSQSSYEPTDADPTPTITGLTGGTFSAGSGLVFVDSGTNTGSSTGEIDLSASTVASYTITYDTTSSGSSVCPNTSTQTVEVAVAGIANNYSFLFDGNNKINSGTANAYNIVTLSAWVKPNSPPNYAGIFGTRNLSGVVLPYHLGIVSNTFRFIVTDSTGLKEITANTSFSNNVWYHVVGVADGSTTKLYIDGVLQTATGSYNGTISTPDDDLMIGAQTSIDTSYEWVGSIDEVAIWNTDLTSTQIQSIYDAKGTNLTKDLTTVSGSNLVYWNRMGD